MHAEILVFYNVGKRPGSCLFKVFYSKELMIGEKASLPQFAHKKISDLQYNKLTATLLSRPTKFIGKKFRFTHWSLAPPSTLKSLFSIQWKSNILLPGLKIIYKSQSMTIVRNAKSRPQHSTKFKPFAIHNQRISAIPSPLFLLKN
ncbi:hypothetical protein PEDI_27770 [Persicobacter diffluens]|uniref:Uncharacterized protein n=1 Tax=Persicobacter diffluens TaxID=981 RepID=A0AAN4W1K3_9BACT|nr:hypothetical protein PEDI_27770 [Persicobacter diffluens]